MKKPVMFAVLTILLVTMMIIPNLSTAFGQTNKVKWELVYLSPYGGCTNYQIQMSQYYAEVTSKYFDAYKIANEKAMAPKCIPNSSYSKLTPQDLTLIIIVEDIELGRKDLNKNNVGGFYNHVGNDKTKDNAIVFCDCSSFKFSDPTWILSHELSHFILYYEDYDKSIYENMIHTMSTEHDQCQEGKWNSTCASLISLIQGDYYFSDATVMKPYGPAVINHGPILQNTSIPNSPYVVNTQKEVTKWWLAGKITDNDYETVLNYLIGPQAAQKNIAILDTANNFVMADGPKDKMPMSDQTIYDPSTLWGNNTAKIILSKVPDWSDTNQKNDNHIPQWFKNAANQWLNDSSITFNDYVNSIKSLKQMMPSIAKKS